jgi:spore maturation protein CgeB
MSKQGLLCKGWDFIYIKDKFAVQKLRSLELNAFHLHEAMNPDWHKWCFSEINNSILFAGNTYDYRHYLIRKLLQTKKYEINLVGNRPPRWADDQVKEVYRNKYIVREEKSRWFGQSLACINSTAMSEFDSLNCRAFEIAGAGGLQIMEYRDSIEECCEPGKEILVYKTFDELTENLDQYGKDQPAALFIRQAGHKRAKSDHSYEKRLTLILNALT